MGKSAAERQRDYRARIKAGIILPPKTAKPHRQYKDKWAYGVHYEFRDELYSAQANRCAICKKHAPGELVMDHDHTTGQVRGLLCKWCNAGLGNFKDNPDFLKAAAEYLHG